MRFKTMFIIGACVVFLIKSKNKSALINKENVTISYCLFNQATHDENKETWQRWDSNPRPRRDWCLKPAP